VSNVRVQLFCGFVLADPLLGVICMDEFAKGEVSRRRINASLKVITSLGSQVARLSCFCTFHSGWFSRTVLCCCVHSLSLLQLVCHRGSNEGGIVQCTLVDPFLHIVDLSNSFMSVCTFIDISNNSHSFLVAFVSRNIKCTVLDHARIHPDDVGEVFWVW
jgi:hypothetical protein